jgi:hypothetical protein
MIPLQGKKEGGVLTIFFLALFGQLSFKHLLFSKEAQVELTHFLLFIFKNLRLCHTFYCNLQKPIFVLRVFNQRLHEERIRSMPRRCSKVSCQALTSI